jgi:opine dehydrogenase
MDIAILGGGHGCHAAAADLSEQGHRVRFWRRDRAALAGLREAGGIVLKDAAGSRRIALHRIYDDIAEAVRGAELIVLPTPAIAQHDIARQMAPHLSDGQVVFLAPGTLGSVLMARWVREAGSRSHVSWAETGTLPYLARLHGPNEINVTIRAVRLPTGVYPYNESARALEVIRAAYPSVHACGDALSGALMNAGPIIHPPLVVMNAAPLQHHARWDIHSEGTQPAVRAVTDRLDAERIAVREALGYGAPHYPLADHYTTDRWMYGDAHRKLQKSGDWREHIDLTSHRYITEDIELGLSLLASVARWAAVDAPVSHGLLALAGAWLGRDLRAGPRSFDALGFAAMSRARLVDGLVEGNL